MEPGLHCKDGAGQILLEGSVLVKEGGVAGGEFGEKGRRHGIGILRDSILNVIHFPLGGGMFVHLQLLVEEGIGLLYGVSIGPHFTQLYFS